jgi:REP element-mobilizing transposase RayT
MANTYHRLYLQFVFAVQYRQSLIPKENKEKLHKYITGLVQNRKAKMLAIHCMPDLAHLFVGFDPSVYIPDFIKPRFCSWLQNLPERSDETKFA